MSPSANDFVPHLMTRLREIQKNFHFAQTSDPNIRLADALDSMGLVELIGVLAEDFGVTPDVIDRAVGHTYGTIAEVARCLHAADFAVTATIPIRRQQNKEVHMLSRAKTLNKEAQSLEVSRDGMAQRPLSGDATRSATFTSETMAHDHPKKGLGWLASTSARLRED